MSTAVTQRIVAPDLARGLALFGIAWANISTAWAIPPNTFEAASLGGIRPGGGIVDHIAVVAAAMFAHVRGLPMFSMLLGFGVGLITMSLWRRGYPPEAAQRTLTRRYGFLGLIGVLHCLFLFFGDIIILYSLLSLILIAMIRMRDKTLLIIAAIAYGIYFVGAVVMSFVFADFAAEASSYDYGGAESYLEYLGFNALMVFGYVFAVPVAGLSLFPLMVVGFVAARHGVHKRVGDFHRLLWGTVIVAAVVILFVGLPWGLSATGILPQDWEPILGGLNGAFGYLTGPGICAFVLLICQPLQARYEAGRKLPFPVALVTALGKRSMTGYLLQSVLFLVVTQEFLLGYGAEVGAFGQFLIALGVWAVLIVVAYCLELAGTPGPVEAVHRRLAYGKHGLPGTWQPPALPSHHAQPQPS